MSKGGLPLTNFNDTTLTILFFIALIFGGCF